MNQIKSRQKTEKEQFENKICILNNEGNCNMTAFLTNFKTSSFRDRQQNQQRSAVVCYFINQSGDSYKFYLPYNPYFYVEYVEGSQKQVHSYLQHKLPNIDKVQLVQRIDLQEINHLSGRKKHYLKVSFRTIKDLTNARNPLKTILTKRRRKKQQQNTYNFNIIQLEQYNRTKVQDTVDLILDLRQFDVIYHSRVCIDTGLRAGKWFYIECQDKLITKLQFKQNKQSIPELRILSYDIQTSKQPLKFPDAEINVVMMISMMCQGEAYLIINGHFCGDKVYDFFYKPTKQQYSCNVNVYNQQSEKQTLLRFAAFIQQYRPAIITTFNGDRFDYPFIKKRCQFHNIKFVQEMGVSDQGGQFFGSYLAHLDCYYWVDRDAFLPHGSHGLKAVTKAKLQYDPIQVNPQEMVHIARHSTQRLAEYAVSDAVATYHLYTQHIHDFIFALSTIIPMNPDEVLRKGSGTLCENLLMAQAYKRNIIFPNKKIENFEKFHHGHLLDNQTYTGGKVQCLRTGVYRDDIETQFNLNAESFQSLIQNFDSVVQFAIQHEIPEQSINSISNYEQVRKQVIESLQIFKNAKNTNRYISKPLIYHLDVAAMYPNIILTNRLQPVAVVNDRTCSGCLFNNIPDSDCKRQLQWEWKGQLFPLNKGQYLKVKEKFNANNTDVTEYQNPQQYEKKLKTEVKSYCQKIYKKTHLFINEIKTDTVCMRENSFYVDTVRQFRDRRYQFKRLVKFERSNMEKYKQNKQYPQSNEAKKMMALYESMQLAHKIILNSFYGYVMRRGARWYSMQTAAMVTYIGSNIISDSRNFIEGKIGKPLELDTDGIWLLLPTGFPQNIKINFKNGKCFTMSYPCHILNHHIYSKNANNQYQTLINKDTFSYQKHTEMSIFFEIDGPYKAMMIPAAKQKQKTTSHDIQEHSTQLLKKRYVVFTKKGTISEFKGFQIKRRGELSITKRFQEEIFMQYLKGNNLQQCYAFCAETAMKYINIIIKKGMGLDVENILDYLQQSKMLSKDIKEYGRSKGVAINSAKRLAEFLGPKVVSKGKGGLCCEYIISKYPLNRPVTERAIPTQIFNADEKTQQQFLARWTQNNELLQKEVNIKDILDWDYYFERLSTQIQKMICIPAVMQNISNPVPQIQLPQWLKKKTFDMRRHKQNKVLSYGFVKINNNVISPGKIGSNNTEKCSVMKSQKKQILQIEKNQKTIENKILFKGSHNPYSMDKQFSKWLIEQKKIWLQKKRQSTGRQVKDNGLKSILQIIPDKSVGNFTVWYRSGEKIQQLLVNMNRKYYCQGRGNKKAPRQEGQAMQIIVDEENFQKLSAYYDCILGKSFYETKIPLLTRLIMEKGNVWKIKRQLRCYGSEDIQQIFQEQYLPNLENNSMPIVYIVHTQVFPNRSVWALINPPLKQYQIVFVDDSKINDKNSTKIDELLIFMRKQLGNKQSKINIIHKNTDQNAAQLLNQKLLSEQKILHQPIFVILQGTQTNKIRSYGLKLLHDQLPVLYLGQLKFIRQQMTLLDWQQKILKKIIQSSEQNKTRINKLLNWSRYAHIPICNLVTQQHLQDYITNVTMGRLLHTGDHLIWWNEYNSELLTTYESLTYTGKVINPGLYKTYSIELDMQYLAVNTIANSDDLIAEDRDAALLIQKKGNNYSTGTQSLDQMGRARKAFQYLKKMVKGWLRDFQEYQTQQSFALLKNLHKWIITRSNAMFDPLLLRMVNELMKIVFYFLLNRLTQLGMKIIYANFSKIIVATQKYSKQQASNSIDYILKKALQDKLLRYITLSPLDFLYKALLFQDIFNFVGANDELKFHYILQIDYLLPKNVGLYLKGLIINFVEKICLIKDQLIEQYHDQKMKLILNYNQLINNKLVEFIRRQYHHNLIGVTQKLLKEWNEEQQRQKNVQYTDDDNVSEEGGRNNNNQKIRNQQEEEEEEELQYDKNDSFINDDEQNNNQLDNKQEERYLQKHKIDKQIWNADHKLDMMIETLFCLLYPKGEQNYKYQLIQLRRQVLQELQLEPEIMHRTIQPHYVNFELPCYNCYRVNLYPGKCQQCKQELTSIDELENSIWKMMQEQGRDIYCDRCNRIKQDYLSKCKCGGKWTFKQQPLKWIPFTRRSNSQWNYVNQVFDFMGINN